MLFGVPILSRPLAGAQAGDQRLQSTTCLTIDEVSLILK